LCNLTDLGMWVGTLWTGGTDPADEGEVLRNGAGILPIRSTYQQYAVSATDVNPSGRDDEIGGCRRGPEGA